MIKNFSESELYTFLYDEDYFVYCKKYEDVKDRIKYFNLDNGIFTPEENFYVCYLLDGVIVGVLNYVIPKQIVSPTDQKHYLSYISVDPAHQNKGIAKALIQHWFGRMLKKELGECGCSGYTKKGFEYLKPILEALPFPIQKRNLEF